MKIDTLDKVKELITSEGKTAEFKKSTGQLERGMETICAFLNGEGGTVLFGVHDSGKILGQEVADTTKRDIANAINRIEPQAEVQISYVPLPDSDKQIITLHVEEARYERPFTYKGCPYHRIESVTTTMPQAVYNDLLIARDGHKYRWEKFEDKDISLKDLDENEILKTVRLGINAGRLPENTGTNISSILEKFELMHNGVLNNAAVVLFAKPEIYGYTQCLLRLARFRGTDKMEFIDSQRIQGNIFLLFDAAMAFIFKHLSLSGKIEGFEREEQLTVPYKAIREGVINSLCHRCYREPGGSVGIAIYDDRVEIENPGTLPKGWNLDKLLSEHESQPQNPLIANVLYKRKVLESWGRGINLIMEECEKAHLPKPEFKTSGNCIRLIFRYASINNPTSTPQAPPKHPLSTPQALELLNIIGDGTYSVSVIMEMMQLKDRKHFRKTYLNPALESGLIEPTYPNSPRHPNQEFRITEKGKALLK